MPDRVTTLPFAGDLIIGRGVIRHRRRFGSSLAATTDGLEMGVPGGA